MPCTLGEESHAGGTESQSENARTRGRDVTNPGRLGVVADGPHDTDTCGVLLVDDHDAYRRVARAVVEATDEFELVGEASSGEESIELATRLAPDLIVMDVRMPGIGGVEAAQRVRAILPDAVIVLISVDVDAAIDGLPSAHGADETMPKHALSPNALTAVWRRHRPRSA